MMLCDFQDGKCVRCNRPRPKTKRVVLANCPATPQDWADTEMRLAWLNCPQRGPVLRTISGTLAGCGCGGTTADVYLCQRFDEPVLKQAAARCLETIREQVPGYAGRTCRECLVPTQ